MNTGIKHWAVATSAVVALLSGGTAALAQDDPADSLGDEYAAADYGRVRHAAQGVTIFRAEWDNEQGVLDEAYVNSPVFPGDRITTAGDQRVEIELAGGTLVWIDRRTELTFLSLPDPYADLADNAVLQLAGGRLRMATALGETDEFRVDTPAASIYPLGDADLRIEVDADGRTRVESRRGVVEIVGSGGSVLVRSGTRTEVLPGALPYDAVPFNTFGGDDFDRYVAQREETYRYREGYAGGPEVYRELPSSVRPYYRELSSYGSWAYVDDYGYLWQPAGMAADWRPYHDGYWGYGPSGYFWISHEPWGWAPYHYGRWSWIGGRGWCWSPGRVFAGAWVSWSWGSAYVGWSPLDYWNYPAYRSVLHHGYYDPFAWTFISYHHIHHHHYRHYSVGWDHVSHHVHRNAVVTRPPRVAPGRLASSAAARDRAVRESRDNPRRRLPPREGSRPARGSFRSGEDRLARNPRRTDLRGPAPPAPEGRARTMPPTRRTRDARQPVRRGTTSRGVDRGGRERLPVVTSPRQRGNSGRESTGRSRSPGRERNVSPGTRPRTGSSRSEAASPRQGTAERVRDIYRRMAEPRRTRERPSASRPWGTRSTPRATPPKPTRSRPKATGGSRRPTQQSRPRPKSGGERKSRPPSRSSRRPDAPGRSTERREVSLSSRAPRRAEASKSSPPRERSVRPSTRSSGPRQRPSSARSSTSRRSAPSASRGRTGATGSRKSMRSPSRAPSGGSSKKARVGSSRSSRSPGRSAGGGSRPSKTSSRSGRGRRSR